MAITKLVPETILKYRLYGKPLTIMFKKRLISVSAALVFKLALKKNDKLIFEINDNKLYLFISDKEGFNLYELKSGVLQANAPGILPALFKNKIIKDSEKYARFELGTFKQGKWELIPVKIIYKDKKK